MNRTIVLIRPYLMGATGYIAGRLIAMGHPCLSAPLFVVMAALFIEHVQDLFGAHKAQKNGGDQ